MNLSMQTQRWALLAVATAASIAPSSAVAGQFGALTSTISAPTEIEVGAAARVTVRVEQAAATAYTLNASISESKTCDDPGYDDHQLIIDKEVTGGTASFTATLPNKLNAGHYTICVYLTSVADPSVLFTDQAFLTIRALKPTAARPWTIVTKKINATRLGPLDLAALKPADA